jgi:hypothetical protein
VGATSRRILRAAGVAALLAPFLQGPEARAAGTRTRHRFICVDNGKPNRLVHVDQSRPERNWSVEIPGPRSRDLQVLEGGKVLVSHSSGAAEYDLADGRRGWSVARYGDVNSARRLPNGNTLLGENSRAGVVIHEVDRRGNEVGTLLLKGMRNLRLLRRLGNGNTLLTVTGPNRAIEVDASGEVVWQAKLPGKGYKAVRLPGGTTLVSTATAALVVELDAQGRTVSTVGGKAEHPAVVLDCFSGFDRLRSGNIVVANWLGHGNHGRGPHLIEFDSANRIAWQWADHRAARQVTNVLVLDERVKER